jgi:hypothetical protein
MSPLSLTNLEVVATGGQNVLNSTLKKQLSPLSLTNLQVAIGGQNVLNSTLKKKSLHYLLLIFKLLWVVKTFLTLL